MNNSNKHESVDERVKRIEKDPLHHADLLIQLARWCIDYACTWPDEDDQEFTTKMRAFIVCNPNQSVQKASRLLDGIETSDDVKVQKITELQQEVSELVKTYGSSSQEGDV